MDSPELLLTVAQHFDRTDLDSCSRVSRKWRECFLPELIAGRVFHLTPVAQPQPSLPFLRRYGHNVRFLDCKMIRPMIHSHGPLFPNADSLHLGSRQIEQELASMMPLIRHCPQIHRLELQRVIVGEGSTAPDWKLLSSLQNLAELKVDARLTKTLLGLLLQNCPHLMVLCLKGMRIERHMHDKLIPRLTAMTVIDLIDYNSSSGPDSGKICREILCSSPSMIKLTWPTLIVDRLSLANGQDSPPGAITTGQHLNPSVGVWACTSLQILWVKHLEWSTNSALNGRMMGQLERLRELRHMDVQTMINGGARWRTGAYPRDELATDLHLGWTITTWPLILNYSLRSVQ
ncbi:hypothetical protein EMPS_02453 [Entomortierella parvispora]|uniref:F-box domain-containing protein n=1 Tax=Entomortierella parvispora TaxID=205924 RepID=A0A9P3LTN3_9FUNG|nr:hypothetical protein EMPS_02453 [Entomortierella parvispora]